MRGAVCYTFHISPSQFTTNHIFRHSTPYHITWRDSVVWNLVWCGTFCDARCRVLRLIHPNAAVMWNKVQCKIRATWCDVKCDVQCEMRCEMWWLCDVERWCGSWGIQWYVVMQDVKCGCGILNVEWFDAILMVWCGMIVEMQCVVWNVCWDVVELMLNVLRCHLTY